jgi:hypothetical protein
MKGTIVVVVAAAVLLVGCEEMAPEVASAPAVSEDVERIRTAMAVPDGVEVVTVSMDAGAVVFTVRNPGVEAGAAQVRRLAVAAADGEVAETFETPRRRAVVTDDGVQFVEVATLEEVAVSRHRAQEAHVRAEEFIALFGNLLAAGGLDMDAVRAWHGRQGELVETMDGWLADAWPDREVPCIGELLDIGPCGGPGPGEGGPGA